MMISYSKHGKTGGVKYAINNKTAKVLVGDPQITEQLIKHNKNKLKYRSGIITFEEKNPDKKIVQDVIDHFIKSTFAGLNPEQYNILMVEHTNTNHYHIHFTIVRLELTTGRAFNPHWHREDQVRLIKLQDYLNAKHNLTNPFEAEKAKTLQDIDFKALNRNQKKEAISKFVEQLIIKRRVQNRDELVKYFKDSGIDVVRQSKSFITIKLNDERIRLKGLYYANTFTDIRAVGAELRKREREHTATTPAELERLKRELDRLIQKKAELNRERYKAREQDNSGEHRLRAGDVKKELNNQIHRNSNNKLADRNNRDDISQSEQKMDSAERNQIDRQWNKIHSNRPKQSEPDRQHKADNQVFKTGGISNDSIRTATTRRTTERETAQLISLSTIKAEPEGIYYRVTNNFKQIRENRSRDEERIRRRAEEVRRRNEELKRRAEEIHRQRSEGFAEFARRVIGIVDQAIEYIKQIKDKAKSLFQKLNEMKSRELSKDDIAKAEGKRVQEQSIEEILKNYNVDEKQTEEMYSDLSRSRSRGLSR